ncbi:MAG: Uma2 family endonuclease [Microcystis sp. 53602_E8]|nr:Uma2 family endonuclease [Microcystis sp. 53602_E8]
MAQETLLIAANPLGIKLPPTEDELPSDDGIPMETQRHGLQMQLLVRPLSRWLKAQGREAFVGGNMFVYFSANQVRNEDDRGTDVFVVVDVPRKERKSWVVWEEEKAPDVVIELLSESTAKKDKEEKKLIYQNRWRVTEYFWYDPFDSEDLAGHRLEGGVYKSLNPDAQGRFSSEILGLVLVRWQGIYGDEQEPITWLRWATPAGQLLPTIEELEKQRAEQEKQRAERLAAQLRSLGVEVDDSL